MTEKKDDDFIDVRGIRVPRNADHTSHDEWEWYEVNEDGEGTLYTLTLRSQSGIPMNDDTDDDEEKDGDDE